MQILRFAHVCALILWLGTAAGEIILELVLLRARSAQAQRAYIELHRIIDFVLEGPALLTAVATGALLLWQGGYLVDTHPWPRWLEDKIICGGIAALINLVCVFFVYMRARATDEIMVPSTAPLSQSRVQKWHYAVLSTILGAPFALIALWLGVVKP